MRKLNKRILAYFLGLFLLISAGLIFESCDDLLEEIDESCDHCSANNPWSVDDGSTCYPSKSDCEANESDDCVRCDG